MIVRHCAGGVVFYANKVLLIKNDRGEWTLPKGKIFNGELKTESAILSVKQETGVEGKVLGVAGDSMYEFFSRSRQQQVCNSVTWYIMETSDTSCVLNKELLDGGFFKVKDAIEQLTHKKEKSLVEISYKKYKELKKEVVETSASI
ncbi:MULTISPECIES: NUDIX domain-containing protein [Romboutsia]|uniref:NTP pyrophosphohydrolase including oxidative damage repair enzyme n=1 Tax=Romboutsia hominis TaxID=1507512 RepID=A0A2P2BUB0_9FIRM|nr:MULTISPECIES: NUDIX hydrolase [Romboutsia]MCH1961222.1 NUDIX hydrolase [Romboutsia hominis]MCH1968350.1 NUDIX hydrolase [Romboutsia hominis]MDB8789596.1 NUDIX hydrolase [Romboutsia sp. 1001216sp1]MDB8793798.1 NUDIX hydrolase [Romboutsia sp. 1001216sp1]MDB8797532.1 NUDIX hydrolase [Romboutsia sp. 1001216sp1]